MYGRFRTKDLPLDTRKRLTSKLQRHLSYIREIWIIYKRKDFSRNFKNPKKFWKSEKNQNSRFQNFEKIDLIILPNRSNRSNRKKSLNLLDRFIGQRINMSLRRRVCTQDPCTFLFQASCLYTRRVRVRKHYSKGVL